MARSVAGAASRLGGVAVLAPGPAGAPTPDGLFDVQGIGEDGAALHWPDAVTVDGVVVVDHLTDAVEDLLTGAAVPAASYLWPKSDVPGSKWRRLPVGTGGSSPQLSPYVPVSEVAARHRHRGFGFTGYLLVLAGPDMAEDLPAPAAWLSAAFHESDVVVVADGTATAWRGRALRGRTSVDTRMDLWRLMAHAAVCVDLAPGPLIARECIEALRLGTPIVVPDAAEPAATYAHESGGATFADPAELIAAVDRLSPATARATSSDSGRRYADAAFGDPERLVGQLQALAEI